MSIFTSQFDRARSYADEYAGHHADPGLADPVTRHGDGGPDTGSFDDADWGADWDQDWGLDPGPGSNAEATADTHHDASGTQDMKLPDDAGWKHPDDHADAGFEVGVGPGDVSYDLDDSVPGYDDSVPGYDGDVPGYGDHDPLAG